MTRTEQYRYLREQGLTYQEIATRCGVSHQAVAQACAKEKKSQFRKIMPEDCVYHGLRNWMNENYVSRSELYRRMHNGSPCRGTVAQEISRKMRGIYRWNMSEIDAMLDITGMTYEQLFRDRGGERV